HTVLPQSVTLTDEFCHFCVETGDPHHDVKHEIKPADNERSGKKPRDEDDDKYLHLTIIVLLLGFCALIALFSIGYTYYGMKHQRPQLHPSKPIPVASLINSDSKSTSLDEKSNGRITSSSLAFSGRHKWSSNNSPQNAQFIKPSSSSDVFLGNSFKSDSSCSHGGFVSSLICQ
ncbi:hypothetical protein Ciccas_014415, partial [Cichlidogyrus casuarinus]